MTIKTTLTPGYFSISDTRESGAALFPIPAAEWTTVPLVLRTFPGHVNHFNAQLYFEQVTGVKIAVRLDRGIGTTDDTGQDDRTVKGPVWAFNYHDDDFILPTGAVRSIEVWSDKPCVLATRVVKVTRPVTTDGKTA